MLGDQLHPPIARVVIVNMESTKPMVFLREPAVIFVRLDLRLPPRPRVARHALGPSTKLKTMLNRLPVPIMPPVLLVSSAAHQRLPSIERARIVRRTNFKHRVRLRGLHAHRGPLVVPVKKDPHHPLPPTVPVLNVPRRNTKRKQALPVFLASIGPHAMLEKKEPRHLRLLIVFVPIVKRVNFKPRVRRHQKRVLIALLEKVT